MPSVHLLPAVAIRSVAFSGKSLYMPDSSGAPLEVHALITLPCLFLTVLFVVLTMTHLDDSLEILMEQKSDRITKIHRN